MSFLPVIEYLAGLAVFGFVYWILDGVVSDLKGAGIAQASSAYDLILYFWVGIIVVYLIFGGIYTVRKYNEQQYQQGGGMF